MWIIWVLLSLALIALTLVDAFETIIQPRRVTHRFRFARLYYTSAWRLWRTVALRFSGRRRREAFLSVFGPMSMLGLLMTWLLLLMVAFALLHWAIGTRLHGPDETTRFSTYLYLSGTTIFTLGLGDVVPLGR
ncbi:MAG: two pore domain potassium channel family protein, partial [Anaerolineae bacterium]|nr:two pore domain potassium channel family protein [Phycisphaerae bacterium]